jgi:hypothetical protein
LRRKDYREKKQTGPASFEGSNRCVTEEKREGGLGAGMAKEGSDVGQNGQRRKKRHTPAPGILT